MIWDNAAVWALVGIVLLIAEIFTVSTVLVFFGLAALAVAFMTTTGMVTEFVWQVVAFAAMSVISLLVLRRKFAQVFRGNKDASPAGSIDDSGMIGRQGVVTRAFVNGRGAARIGDTVWEARCAQNLLVGQVVAVVGHEAISVVVVPVSEEAPIH